MNKTIFILFIFLYLFACMPKTALHRSDLPKFNKGNSPKMISQLVTIPPVCSLAISPDTSLRVDVYPMSDTNYNGNYYLLFEDNRLLFWGYPYEYARSKDKQINQVHNVLGHNFKCDNGRSSTS